MNDFPLNIVDGFELLRRARAPGRSGVTIDEVAAVQSGSTISASTHLIGITLAGTCELNSRTGGTSYRGDVSPGIIGFVPAGLRSEYCYDERVRCIYVWVPSVATERALQEMYSVADAVPELRPAFFIRDPLIERLCVMMAQEVQRPTHPAQNIIFDGATLALAAHIVRTFGTICDRRLRRPPSAMSTRALDTVKQYVDDHLHEQISLSELANLAGVSRFHFIRIFRLATNRSPMAYVEQSRIRRATILLQRSDLTISEIARLVGFTDHDHFSRRFKYHVSVTPSAFRRSI